MFEDRREAVMDRILEDRMFNKLDAHKKEMELHRFYLYDKKKDDNPMVPTLYAYTRDSDIADAFKASRNPNLFLYKHSKETIDVIADIEHKHPGIRLRKTKLRSRSADDPTKMIEIPIVLTCEEEIRVASIQDDLFNIVGANKCMADMTVLSNGLNKALNMLGYFEIFRYMSQMMYIDVQLSYFYEGIAQYSGMEPGPLPSIIGDEFSLFMLMFGNTLRG